MCGAELVLSLGLHWQSVRELLNSPFCLASWYSHWWCRIQALKWITKINLVVMQKMWDNAQISLSPDLGELFPVSFIHIFFHLRFRVSLELKVFLKWPLTTYSLVSSIISKNTLVNKCGCGEVSDWVDFL